MCPNLFLIPKIFKSLTWVSSSFFLFYLRLFNKGIGDRLERFQAPTERQCILFVDFVFLNFHIVSTNNIYTQSETHHVFHIQSPFIFYIQR